MCFLLVFISLPCLPLSPPRCCPDSHSPLVFGRAFQLNTTFSSKLTSSCVPDSSCFNSLVAMTVLTFLALGEAPPVELPHGILAGSCDPTKGFAIVGGVTFVLSPSPSALPPASELGLVEHVSSFHGSLRSEDLAWSWVALRCFMLTRRQGLRREIGQNKNVAFVPLPHADVLSPKSTRRLFLWSAVVRCTCVRTCVDVTVAFQLSAVQCDCAAGSALSARSSEIAMGHSCWLSTCSVAAGVTSGTFH